MRAVLISLIRDKRRPTSSCSSKRHSCSALDPLQDSTSPAHRHRRRRLRTVSTHRKSNITSNSLPATMRCRMAMTSVATHARGCCLDSMHVQRSNQQADCLSTTRRHLATAAAASEEASEGWWGTRRRRRPDERPSSTGHSRQVSPPRRPRTPPPRRPSVPPPSSRWIISHSASLNCHSTQRLDTANPATDASIARKYIHLRCGEVVELSRKTRHHVRDILHTKQK